jgi:hypothetical protein
MSYIRHDENNVETIPQPNSNTISAFAGNEGWSEIEYQDWNADYVARNDDNTERAPGSYQRYDDAGNPITSDSYQRHDENCNPIYE